MPPKATVTAAKPTSKPATRPTTTTTTTRAAPKISSGAKPNPASGAKKATATSTTSTAGSKEQPLKAKKEEKMPAAVEEMEAVKMSEAETKARTVLCRFDEDQDEALSMRELANLIRDVSEEECKFCEECEMGNFIKRQMNEWDKDGDRKLNAQEFLGWYGQFRSMIDNKLGQEREEKAKQEAAKASALQEMFAKIEQGGLCTCTMPVLPEAIEKSLQMGKTPLLLDHTVAVEGEDFSPLEVFYSYSNDALIEMKKFVVEVNMKKTMTVDEALDQMRRTAIGAMKYGKDLVILMSNSAPPITSKFNSPSKFPLAFLDANQVNAVRSTSYDQWPEDSFLSKLVDFDADKISVIHKDFKVVCVTKFQTEDYEEFLKSELPLAQMQPIRVLTVGQK